MTRMGTRAPAPAWGLAGALLLAAGCAGQGPPSAEGPTDPEPLEAALEEGDERRTVRGSGHRQSPVNVVTRRAAEDGDTVSLRLRCADRVEAVAHQAHTVQLDFAPGSWTEAGGHRYALRQAHFHTPSEHQLDGMTFPLEMHVVHTPEPGDTTAAPYLVLGVLFRMGDTCRFLEEFLDEVPPEPGAVAALAPDQVHLLDLLDAFPEHGVDHYWHYEGSLTTPPYTEGVQWYLSEHVFDASPEQIHRLRELEGANARPLQELADRTVEHH